MWSFDFEIHWNHPTMEMNKKFFLIQCLISFYLFSLCLDISLLVGFYFCLFVQFFFKPNWEHLMMCQIKWQRYLHYFMYYLDKDVNLVHNCHRSRSDPILWPTKIFTHFFLLLQRWSSCDIYCGSMEILHTYHILSNNVPLTINQLQKISLII